MEHQRKSTQSRLVSVRYGLINAVSNSDGRGDASGMQPQRADPRMPRDDADAKQTVLDQGSGTCDPGHPVGGSRLAVQGCNDVLFHRVLCTDPTHSECRAHWSMDAGLMVKLIPVRHKSAKTYTRAGSAMCAVHGSRTVEYKNQHKLTNNVTMTKPTSYARCISCQKLICAGCFKGILKEISTNPRAATLRQTLSRTPNPWICALTKSFSLEKPKSHILCVDIPGRISHCCEIRCLARSKKTETEMMPPPSQVPSVAQSINGSLTPSAQLPKTAVELTLVSQTTVSGNPTKPQDATCTSHTVCDLEFMGQHYFINGGLYLDGLKGFWGYPILAKCRPNVYAHACILGAMTGKAGIPHCVVHPSQAREYEVAKNYPIGTVSQYISHSYVDTYLPFYNTITGKW